MDNQAIINYLRPSTTLADIVHRHHSVWRSLVVAVLMATFWFLVNLFLIQPNDLIVDPWYDQSVTFTQVGKNLVSPYETLRFVNPPWAALVLLPFSLMSLNVAVLLQLWLTFGLLAMVLHKYGGSTWHVWLTTTSFIAFDVGLEVNIDWIAYLALLVPPYLAGPLLLVKPQVALGAYIGETPRHQIHALLGILLVLLVSWLIWGQWGADFLGAIERDILNNEERIDQFNLAPSALMPPLLSYSIGLGFAFHAFRIKQDLFGLYAWFFLVPYMPFYTTLLYLGLLSIRLPLLALIITAVMWVIFGGVILLAVLL